MLKDIEKNEGKRCYRTVYLREMAEAPSNGHSMANRQELSGYKQLIANLSFPLAD